MVHNWSTIFVTQIWLLEEKMNESEWLRFDRLLLCACPTPPPSLPLPLPLPWPLPPPCSLWIPPLIHTLRLPLSLSIFVEDRWTYLLPSYSRRQTWLVCLQLSTCMCAHLVAVFNQGVQGGRWQVVQINTDVFIWKSLAKSEISYKLMKWPNSFELTRMYFMVAKQSLECVAHLHKSPKAFTMCH